MSINQHCLSPKNVLCSLLSLLLLSAATRATQAAIISTPGLTAVRVWETTGLTIPYDFAFNGTEMTNELGVGVLGPGTNDFASTANEYVDVFYSDAAGNFNINGDYVTVEAVFGSSAGSGLNLAAVDLIIGSSTVRADTLASFVGLGTSYSAGSELLAVDSDTPTPTTWAAMGSTATPATQHLRVTVGWSTIPEPSACLLMALGLGATVMLRGRASRT